MEETNEKLKNNKRTVNITVWRKIFKICKFIKIIKSTLKIKYKN